MKRNYKSKSIKSILENFVEQENLVDGIFNIKIKEAWEKAVEKKIFDYTKEIYVKGDILFTPNCCRYGIINPLLDHYHASLRGA